jgi:hypothetical protein
MLRFALIRHSVLRAEDVFNADGIPLWNFWINFGSSALYIVDDHTVAHKFWGFRQYILKLLQIVSGVQWVLRVSRARGFKFPRLGRRLLDVCVRQIIFRLVKAKMELARGRANDVVVLVYEFGFISFLFRPHFWLGA